MHIRNFERSETTSCKISCMLAEGLQDAHISRLVLDDCT